MLGTLINDYIAIQKKEDELKVEKAHLADTIMKEMTTSSYKAPNGVTAIKAVRETISYNNEAELIGTLKANGLEAYVVEKIDAPTFNKALKENAYPNLFEGMYSTKSTNVLSIKQPKVIEG